MVLLSRAGRVRSGYPRAMVRSALLVGREDEQFRLADALARCRSGTGGVVLISGEAGVGKSRLVAQALSTWEGTRVSATAVAGGGAYAPFAGLMRLQSRHEPDHPGNDEDWRNEPDRTIPEAICAAARRGPTVLVVEDLHVADSATIDMLGRVAETLESERFVVLGVYRSDELPRTHPLRGLRNELRRRRRLVDICLRPLTRMQTGQLLGALLDAEPSAPLVDAVHARSEGLPFFVEELVAALADGDGLIERGGTVDLVADAALPLPESVVDAVLTRTRGLRDQHEDAVEYAATLGVQVDLPALAALVGPGEVDALIDDALLLEVDADIAVFRHALVREAIYRSIPWARRRGRHQRVAELLTRRGDAPAVVADHWVAARVPEKARPLLLAAAAHYCEMSAYRDAAAFAKKALRLWPASDDPADRLVAIELLADCVERSGDLPSAVDIWGDVARQHRRAGNPTGAAKAHRRAANSAEMMGDLSRTVVERTASAEAFTQAEALSDAAAERLALAEQLKAAGRFTEALEQLVAATGAAALAERRDLQAHALALQGAVRAALGEGQYGVELARSGLRAALTERLTVTAGHAYYELGEALEYAADYAAAVAAYESAFELCRANGISEFGQICFVCMSPVVRLMGGWDRTLAICAEVLANEASIPVARKVAEEESGLISALRGDARRARGPLRRAADFGRSNGIFGLEVGATWGLAVVGVLDQNEDMADYAVSTLLERCSTTEECHYALPALRWAATFLAERDHGLEVAKCHRVVATLATRNGSSKVLSALAHVGAELAMAEGDLPQASAQFTRSVELLNGITAPYEQAHTQLRSAHASTALGDRDAAIATATSAYHTANHLKAKPLAYRCAATLAGMGEHVDQRLGRRAAHRLNPEALSMRELQVLRHLADGRTNREIAALLFLSTRTVDMHVRNLFTKLDCSSRTQAVQVATRKGLLTAEGKPLP